MKSRKIIHLPPVVLAVVSPTRMCPTRFLGVGGGVSSDVCIKSPWAAVAELVLCCSGGVRSQQLKKSSWLFPPPHLCINIWTKITAYVGCFHLL